MTKVVEIDAPNNRTLNDASAEEMYSLVDSDISSVKDYFRDLNEKRERNFSFYKGNQWTAEEIQSIRRQFRIPYKFNEIRHKVDHLIGSYTQTRMDTKCIPRESSDSEAAELLNFVLKWVEQLNRIDYIEREVFRDAIVGGYGVSVVRWENENLVEGYPVVEKIPAEEIVWDVNAKDILLRDARWMARIMYAYRDEAKEMFPNYSEIIDGAAVLDPVMGEDSAISPQQRRVFETLRTGTNEFGLQEMVRIIEYYRKEKAKLFIVIDQISGKIKYFEQEKNAKEFYNGLVEGYIKATEVLDNPDGTSRVLLTSTYEDVYYQTIVIGDQVIEHNLVDLPFFPWVVCFAYFHDGDSWAFVDDLIDPQILVNRSFSMWDYEIGAASKNMMTVIPNLLATGFDMESFRSEASKNSPIIPVKTHLAIQQFPSGAAQPQLFENIGFGIQRMTDYAGGKNTLGLQENAAESGKAVIARAEQGGLARLPLFDNLKLWKEGVTERIVWWIKNYMTAGQIIRITGDDKNIKYLRLNDGLINTLQEVKTDIIVEEVARSESVNERYFQQLKELFMVVPGVPPEVMFRIMLPYSSLPETKKEELIQMIGGYQEYMTQQAMQQQQQKLFNQARDQVIKKQIKEQLTRGDDLQAKKEKVQREYNKIKKKQEEVERIKNELESGSLAANVKGVDSREDIQNLQREALLSKLL